MKKRYRDMVATRRLYKLEESLYSRREFKNIVKKRSLPALRKLTYVIWKKERMKGPVPCVQFGGGIPHGDELFSWCDGETIELSPTQRDILTLLHEITHAMGYGYHNREFVDRYLDLLVKYTSVNEQIIFEAFSEL